MPRAFGLADASRRWWLVLAVLVGAAVFVYRPQARERVDALDGSAMGTTWRIAFGVALDAERAAALQRGVDSVLADYNARFSTYVDSSELSRLNARRDTSPHAISTDLARVLQVAARVHAASGGSFDPTVGPLVDAWGFGPAGRPEQVPDDSTLATLRRRVGLARLVELGGAPDAPTVRKRHPDVALDLSAVAKGDAVDVVTAWLRSQGAVGALVEIGGEVRVFGRAEGGRPFRVGIESPDPAARRVAAAVTLDDEALATSGNYRNRFERDGVSYGHTLDPRTGRPAAHTLLSASVITPTCAEADAWATALMVVGPDSAQALAERAGLAVLLLIDAPGDSVQEWATASFRARMVGPRETSP